MEQFNTYGLILRSVPYRESSRMLSILTSDHGKIEASASGTQSGKSMLRAAVQPFVFSEMTLAVKRERYTLVEANIVEQFTQITYEIRAYALAAYFAEIALVLGDADKSDAVLLSVMLNALRELCSDRSTFQLIKAATELKMLSVSGYMPPEGSVSLAGIQLDIGSYRAMDYIVKSDPHRIYSFSLENMKTFAKSTEKYVQDSLERTFRTLDYYKSL